jgi:hypothetical protein
MYKFDLRNKYNSNKTLKQVEMPGIEPGAFHMQSERSTTELHPLMTMKQFLMYKERNTVYKNNVFIYVSM